MNALFISDLHLDAERPDIARAFLRFLSTRAVLADALYILGDFFEAWIGDDGMDEFQQGIAKALHHVSAGGTRVFLMHGNRDFLIGEDFCRLAGCELLAEGSTITLNGKPVLLLHGDSLCTRDERYQQLRKRLRNPATLWLLQHLPLGVRRSLAQKLRTASKAQTRSKPADIIDVTPEAVVQLMAERDVRTMIHGHTHRPARHDLMVDGHAAERFVLGDWDTLGWVLAVDSSGYRLESFPIESAAA